MPPSPTFLIVPGLREHVEEHWQTFLAQELPQSHTVAPLEHEKLSCQARVAAIEQALARIEGPVVIVAHSAGAMMVAHWALRGATRPIQAALLVAPADLETPMPAPYPRKDALQSNGWLPIPRQPLPFPSMVAASSNDPLAALERTRSFAKDWGSTLVELGPVGHLNPASGYGHWPRAKTLIDELMALTASNTANA